MNPQLADLMATVGNAVNETRGSNSSFIRARDIVFTSILDNGIVRKQVVTSDSGRVVIDDSVVRGLVESENTNSAVDRGVTAWDANLRGGLYALGINNVPALYDGSPSRRESPLVFPASLFHPSFSFALLCCFPCLSSTRNGPVDRQLAGRQFHDFHRILDCNLPGALCLRLGGRRKWMAVLDLLREMLVFRAETLARHGGWPPKDA